MVTALALATTAVSVTDFGSSDGASPATFFFLGAAFWTRSRIPAISTLAAVSAPVVEPDPPNHSLIVSANPIGIDACGVVTPSMPSLMHFSMMSFVGIPRSLATCVIRIFLTVLVATIYSNGK